MSLLKNTAFLALLFVGACQERSPIDAEKMTAVLVDAVLLEAGHQQKYNFGVLPDSAWLRDYRFVLTKHGLDTGTFYPAMRWYKDHPDAYAQVWESVITELQNKELARRQAHP